MRTTAAGSLPGQDFAGAVTAMAETFPEIVPWPELPARGPGSGMIGRALGIIDTLSFDLQPAGWRLVPGSSRDHRRAASQWRADLDDAEERLQGFTGVLKIGLAGPWTLAASVERPMGDRLLADHGARRELAQALAQAAEQLRVEVQRRLPGTTVIFQIDEPALVAVAAGAIPTASGFSKHRAVAGSEIALALKPLAEGAWMHCCAPGHWIGHARAGGFDGVAVDTRCFPDPRSLEPLAEWVHDGKLLAAGVVDTSRRQVVQVDDLVHEAVRVLPAMELSGPQWENQVVLSSGCGFAGWEISAVPQQLQVLVRATELTAEALQGS